MEESKPKDISEESVQFRYLKSAHFRVILANGAWGGITPHGEIHMVIWNERPSIPDATVQAITKEGTLGREISREGQLGAVRECEADVVMNYATAKAVATWLNNHLQQLEKVISETREATKKTMEPQEHDLTT